MSTGASMQSSHLEAHGDHLPTDLHGGQPAGGDGVAGPLDPTVHLVSGHLPTAQ